METISPEKLLIKITKILESLNIKYFITGGFAVSVWGRPRATFDSPSRQTPIPLKAGLGKDSEVCEADLNVGSSNASSLGYTLKGLTNYLYGVIIKNMVNQDVLIRKGIIEKKAGVVIFDLEKYQLIKKELGEYRKKERLLRSLKNFEDLAKWGRSFAKKKNITKKQVLDND